MILCWYGRLLSALALPAFSPLAPLLTLVRVSLSSAGLGDYALRCVSRLPPWVRLGVRQRFSLREGREWRGVSACDV